MIEIKDITKTYGSGDTAFQALKGISFTIKDGEFIAIMGPSGSGKSTLMHILGCLDTLTTGTYFLDGKDVSTLTDEELAEIRRLHVGFVFQSFNLIPNLSALENVMLPMEFAGTAAPERRRRAADLLTRVGLATRLTHRPRELSGGEQQRVAIARALLKNPPIMIFDEATSALDSESEILVQEAMERLMQNRTSFVIAHRLSTIRNADRILVLEHGKIVQEGRHVELLKQTKGLYKKLHDMQFAHQ